MTPTLTQIASKAGLSIAAVSKALSDRPDISPNTRRRVQRLAQEMGYVRNPSARALVMKKTLAIGVVLSLPHIPTVTDRLRGIQAAAQAHHYLTTVAFHDGSAAAELQQIEMLYGRVDGLVITPSNQTPELAARLQQLRLPVVCMSEPLAGMETDWAGDDDAEGGRLAAGHLLEKGCRRIAYLGCEPSVPSDRAMLKSLREVLSGAGLVIDETLARWGNATAEATRANVHALLAQEPRPDAIVAFSDLTALWALEQLETQGIKVPDEIAVVGYDNTELAPLGRVPLTSVAQPNFEIGQEAARLLIERLTGAASSAPCRQVVFRPSLVIRKSSQFPRRG